MEDGLEARLGALERAVTEGEHADTEFEAIERLEDIESRVDELDDRIAELEAATQALRGYVGNIRSVNQEVEQRADAALAKAETLETALEQSDSHAEPTPAGDRHEQRRQRGPLEDQPLQASPDGGVHLEDTDRRADNHRQPCPRCDGDQRGLEDEASGEPRETLVPETTETGPLQRLRDLL